MSYDDPAQAIDALEAIYDAQCKQAERYAGSEHAKQNVLDKRFEELARFYAALACLDSYRIDLFWCEVVRQVAAIRLNYPEIDGAYITVDFRPGAINRVSFHHKHYVEATI